MTITPYINLAGDAEEALNFYKDIFGGAVDIMRWGEMPPDPHMPISDEWKEKIMHATLTIKDDLKLYISDSFTEKKIFNSNIVLHIEFETEERLREVYKILSEEGEVNMPLDKTFWGSIYGDLKDKFGTSWGLHYTLDEPGLMTEK